MKIVWHIFKAVLITVYVIVALLNMSVVQSVAGSWAGNWLSNETGGTFKIGSLGCNLMGRLVLRDVEMIDPSGDTICQAGKITVSFDGFPIDDEGLKVGTVYVKDTYYHLATTEEGINLKFLLDHFKSDKPKQPSGKNFKVMVDELIMENVNYKQDLFSRNGIEPASDSVGVDVRHMYWANINGRVRNIRVDKSHVTCQIDEFTTREISGLTLEKMKMNVYVSPSGIGVTNMELQTGDSRLVGDVLLDFRDWKTMKHYVDSVYMTCHFEKGSYGSMRDAAFWAHKLWGMDLQAEIDGYVGGPVQDLHADGIHLAFGENTRLDMDAYIYGLPNIDTTIIGGEIRNMHVTYEDLAAVKHPRNIKMKAEEIIRKLSDMDIDATFVGTIRDFYATIDMDSKLGDLKGDVVLAMDPKKGEFKYVGELSSNQFALGAVAPNEWVSQSGLQLSFEGSGFDPRTMNAWAEGRLVNTTFRGQRIHGESSIEFEAQDGKMTTDVMIDDALANVTAHGEAEWRENGPSLRADVEAVDVDLKRLGLWSDTADDDAKISARLTARYIPTGENRYFARASVENLDLETTTKDYQLKSLTITAREQAGWKNLTIAGDVCNAQMRGYYEYDGIGLMLKKFAADFLPQSIVSVDRKKPVSYDKIADAQFELDLEWTDTTGILETFMPLLYVSSGTTVQANYNFVESFKPLIRCDSARWGNVKMYNIGINGESVADHYRMRVRSDEISVGDMLLAESTDLDIETSRRATIAHLLWENSDEALGGGDINLRIESDSLKTIFDVGNSQLALGGRDWLLTNEGGEAWIEGEKVRVRGLRIESDDQMLTMNMLKGGKSEDGVVLLLSNLGTEILNPILASKGITLGGIADGRVYFASKGDVPYLNAEVNVSNLTFNNESLGDAVVRSRWAEGGEDLELSVSTLRFEPSEAGPRLTKPLSLRGKLKMTGDDPKLDFTARVGEMSLQSVQPFVKSFSSYVDGIASADLVFTGTLKNPEVNGSLYVEEGIMQVDFLNVAFGFSDTLAVDNEAIKLDHVLIRDNKGNKAYADGAIRHKGLKDFRFDVDIVSDRLLCMNTTSRHSKLYYGQIIASANCRVRGPLDDIVMVVDARTLPGSVLNVPISDKRQVKEADYIHFVSDADDNIGFDNNASSTGDMAQSMRRGDTKDENSGNKYHLTINVETTPDLRMQLPMDFSSVTANVVARGSGDLQMLVTSETPFTLIGDYEIDNGTVGLNILGLKSMDFDVDEGSSITFPGAVGDALFDIKAAYSQRVNMSSLTGTLSSTESQKSINVENVIALSGTLQSPDINFDIRLPNADQSVQEEVFAYIDRNNERDMLNQTVSLLLFNQFYNSSTASDAATTSVVDEGYGIVANQLGNVVSSMVQFVDVNFKYTAGNSLTTEQYAVDISKEWNKFYFETTLGFGGEAREMSSVSNNNMTGDVLVGYKINPRLHLFVFNRSNTNDYTRSDLPYKQGVGLKYTRDFDRFKELFLRRKRKDN